MSNTRLKANESGMLLEAERGKETDSILEPPEKIKVPLTPRF